MTMTVQEWAQKIASEAANPVVIELGAHHGQDTTRIYDACRAVPVYLAVEASPRNILVLRRVIGNRIITLIHAAISNHVGEAIFRECEGNNNASGSILHPKDHLTCFPHITFEHDVVVPSITLDKLSEKFGILEVDLIWCDIQGAEGMMIAGGQRTLERTKHLVIEADALEMYEGQVTRATIEELLPDFDIVEEWPVDANVLFHNRNLK